MVVTRIASYGADTFHMKSAPSIKLCFCPHKAKHCGKAAVLVVCCAEAAVLLFCTCYGALTPGYLN